MMLSVPAGADLTVTLHRHGTEGPLVMRNASVTSPSDSARLLSEIVQPFIGWESKLDDAALGLVRTHHVKADILIEEQTRADIFGDTTFVYPLFARPVLAVVERYEMDGKVTVRSSRLRYLVPHDRVRLLDAALANVMALGYEGSNEHHDDLARCMDGIRQMDAYKLTYRLTLRRESPRTH